MSETELERPATLRIPIRRRFFRLFLPCVAALLTVTVIYFRLEYRGELDVIRAREVSAVQTRQDIIRNDFQSILSDLMYLAEKAGGHDPSFPDSGGGETDRLASEFLVFCRYKRSYDQIRLLDATGMERVRVNDNGGNPTIVSPEALQSKGERYYFRDTMKLAPGQVFVSPFDLNIENGRIEEPFKPMIRFGTPLTNEAGEKTGAVVLNYLGKFLIQKIGTLFRHGEGETMLMNAEGFWMVAPDARDEWGFMFPDRRGRVFGGRFPDAWSEISLSETGQLMTGQGIFTFTTIYPLREGLFSSTGAAEAFAPSERRIEADEYRWKLVSRVPERVIGDLFTRVTLKFLALNFFLFVFAVFGCRAVAVSRVRREEVEAEKVRVIRQLRKALAEVKTLTGLIPICAYCKNIRDDQGYWKRLESYFQERSGADFTHSICPECEKKVLNEEMGGDD